MSSSLRFDRIDIHARKPTLLLIVVLIKMHALQLLLKACDTSTFLERYWTIQATCDRG